MGGTLGLQLQELTPELANSMGLEGTEGVLVANVERNSSGAEAGVKRGDVILEVNRKIVRNPSEYRRVIKSTKKKDAVLLLVRRGNSSIYIAVR